MKVVVIGGTGLIGAKVVEQITEHGHVAVAASPKSGVDVVTTDGLLEVLADAQVIVDVANSPSFDDEPAWDFFTTATRNLLTAGRTAGVAHHVALSVNGTDRLLASGYFRAKHAQERLIRESSAPYSIVHATQFYEIVAGIADAATDGETVRISPALIQPMAADDVAAAVTRTALGAPFWGTREFSGPQRFSLDDLVRTRLRAAGDERRVLTDGGAPYFGVVLDEHTLLPGSAATTSPTRFADWLVANARGPVR